MLYLEINEGKHSLEVKLSCDIVKKENMKEFITYIFQGYFPFNIQKK